MALLTAHSKKAMLPTGIVRSSGLTVKSPSSGGCVCVCVCVCACVNVVNVHVQMSNDIQKQLKSTVTTNKAEVQLHLLQ